MQLTKMERRQIEEMTQFGILQQGGGDGIAGRYDLQNLNVRKVT
jgi:hypothetical protein